MKRTAHPVQELQQLSRTFGKEAARRKLALLEEIDGRRGGSARRIRSFHDTLYFMRAYPDDAALLRAVRHHCDALRDRVLAFAGDNPDRSGLVDHGLPGSSNCYVYSYDTLRRLVPVLPGCLEFDWDALEDESALADALSLTVSIAEAQGLEDIDHSLREWLEDCQPASAVSTLQFVLDLFASSTLSPEQQTHVFDACRLWIRYRLDRPGTGRCEIAWPVERIRYQKREISRQRFPLKPEIRRPLELPVRLPAKHGRAVVELCLRALCSRNLEIYPLTFASDDDVRIVDCGRGIQVTLIGELHRHRSALESVFFFMISKNGVPIAYGPASVFLGCCEMGINLFPEFRGMEIRYVYAQFMRTLYHLAAVRYFFLTSYGMGEGNPEAIDSGAFWFYRKLGFAASNPEVEVLAQQEEALMRRDPSHRSSRQKLRELSYTAAYLDLSGGRCRPFPVGPVGLAVSRFIGERYNGNRAVATADCTRRLKKLLGITTGFRSWRKAEQQALESLAPTMLLLPDLERWPARDKQQLARILRAKGKRDEVEYIRLSSAHTRLETSLRRIIDQG